MYGVDPPQVRVFSCDKSLDFKWCPYGAQKPSTQIVPVLLGSMALPPYGKLVAWPPHVKLNLGPKITMIAEAWRLAISGIDLLAIFPRSLDDSPFYRIIYWWFIPCMCIPLHWCWRTMSFCCSNPVFYWQSPFIKAWFKSWFRLGNPAQIPFDSSITPYLQPQCHDFSLLQQHRDAFAEIQFGNHASGRSGSFYSGWHGKKWRNLGDDWRFLRHFWEIC